LLSITGSRQAYFWGTHSGAELDLMLLQQGRRYGVEFKASDAPKMTKSIHVALQDLHLEKLLIVYPGSENYLIDDQVEVVSLAAAMKRFHHSG